MRRLDLPDREPLGVSPAVGITTESTSDTPLPSPFIPSSVLTPDWKDNTWPGIITGRIATPVVASGFSGISGGDVGIATFPPGFFDLTGPGLTPAVNYYVNYSEIVSTGLQLTVSLMMRLVSSYWCNYSWWCWYWENWSSRVSCN